MMKHKSQLFVATVLLAAASVYAGAAAKISVDVAHPVHAIAPTLWGIFFEDINLSADGGIYPELVQNRSFEDADKADNWKFTSANGKSSISIAVPDYAAKPAVVPLNPLNRKALRIAADGVFTLANEGYWGMHFVTGDGYTLKFAARVANGFTAPLTVKLVSADDSKTLASGQIKGFTDKWAYYTLDLTPTATDAKGKLVLSGEGKGTVVLDMISLMPKKTWKNHGLRIDLAESIDALKPAFLRFPGGCWVEGETMDKMYDWKKTIGDVDARTPLWNIWKYNATHGLGYHEYLVMAEDLGAEPLFDINCGMSHREVVPMSQMGRWVQDALDAIEYANGPVTSYWGGLRAKAGHPAPFNLKYLEIGNENGGEEYRERWALMHEAIKAKYPEVKLVANHWKGGYPKTPQADIVDEHFYNSPEWFMAHADYYDKYDRNSPKIFVGEYAVTRNCGLGNLRGAIGEAAWMTGLERNSDHVVMASYAPLFVNLNHRAWNPDLINFDSSRWYGLPSYYVQKLFAENRGDVYLTTKVEAGNIEEKPPVGCIGVGTWNTQAEFKDIKVTAPDGKVLLDSNAKTDWKFFGKGEWTQNGGVLKQTAEKEFVRALAGDRAWGDYTLELKARKTAGREGFLVLFHISGDDDRMWWNVGGWNNSQSGVEIGETRDPKKVKVEDNKWYDLKVEVRAATVKCWLDGRLIHDIKDALTTTRGIYATSARNNKTGELILKVVNAAHTPTEVTITLEGGNQLGGEAKGVVLTSADAKDENTIDLPEKVSPKPISLKVAGGVIKHAFPGNSFTVLRLKSK